MVSDNVPLSAAAIAFSAFAKEYGALVQDLMDKGIHPSEAAAVAKDLAGHFLDFTNQNKFAESVSELTFTPSEDCGENE